MNLVNIVSGSSKKEKKTKRMEFVNLYKSTSRLTTKVSFTTGDNTVMPKKKNV